MRVTVEDLITQFSVKASEHLKVNRTIPDGFNENQVVIKGKESDFLYADDFEPYQYSVVITLDLYCLTKYSELKLELMKIASEEGIEY